MENQNPFDLIAIFNTYLGLTNMEKNTISQVHSQKIEDKVDLILERLDNIERRMDKIGNGGERFV